MMEFYRLTHPKYISDLAYKKHNPVKLLKNISIPSIICDDCGLWCGSGRIRKEIKLTPKALDIINMRSIHINDWNKMINLLGTEVGIEPGLLKPGTELGIPRGEIANFNLHDFIHPFPGQIWVKENVINTLLRTQVKGVEFCKIETRLKKARNKDSEKPVELWELVVKGMAWRKGVVYEDILACEKCKRTIFPDPEWLQVDEDNWDGSDFFILDMNPNIIIVTKKVYDLFNEKRYTNFICINTFHNR